MGCVHAEVLVDTKWADDHKNDPKVRIAEVDFDPSANYMLGHIPGSVLFDWKIDINDPLIRNVLNKEVAEKFIKRVGINNDTTLVLYGDFNNWFAVFTFWVLKYYGVKDVRLMKGGRKKWVEEDRTLTKDIPSYAKGNFKASGPDRNIRVFLKYVKDTLGSKVLVDVRSPKEFTCEILARPEYHTEHAQRRRYIPGAVNLPWAQAVNENGSFKSTEELENLYAPMLLLLSIIPAF